MIKNFKKYILDLNLEIKNLLKFNELFGVTSYEILLLCHDDDRNYVYQGRKYSQIIDSLKDSLEKRGYNTITIQYPYSFLKKKEIYGNTIIVNGIFARAAFIERIVRFITLRRIEAGRFRINKWKTIFNKIKPKIILAIQPSKELCIAAKDLDIWVSDVQHGVIAFGDYYDLDYRNDVKQKGWPNDILCWDKNAKDFIDEHFSDYVDAKVIGHPFVLRFLDPAPNDLLVSDALKNVRSKISDNYRILISAQWGYEHVKGIGCLGIPRCVPIITREMPNDIEWWIRLHPITIIRYGSDAINQLLEDEFHETNNVFWDFPTTSALPAVLFESQLHLTYSSAVTKEASMFCIKTALLYHDESSLLEWFPSEISSGLADIINDKPSEVKKWINSNRNNNEINNLNILIQHTNNRNKFINYVNKISFNKLK